MAEEALDPMTPSGDTVAMTPFWDMVGAILGGAPALRAATHKRESYIPGPAQPVNELGELQRGAVKVSWNESPYLPKFPNESNTDYEIRRCHAPLTNIYGEISDNLSGKPFEKPCELDEDEPDELKELSKDIDGQGHSLHAFAKDHFKSALDKGIDWILVEYTRLPTGVRTKAEEKSMGARPYWVHIPANRMLAVYSVFANGQEVISYARIYEPEKRQSGYGEECVDRVRELKRDVVIDPVTRQATLGGAYWYLHERQTVTKEGRDETSWVLIGSGELSIGEIPLVPLVPAGRKDNSWQVNPAFRDLAYMQVELFQKESNAKSINDQTCYPMLAGNGVTPPDDGVLGVGPRAVLYAPMGQDGSHGEWTSLSPDAACLDFLETNKENYINQMRNLGRQPLMQAQLTVVTAANAAQKANSAVQGWALLLKDSLERAWALTCKWLGQDKKPVVNVHVDFGVEMDEGADLTALQQATDKGTLSKQTHFEELQRRGKVSSDRKWDEEQERMAEEQEGQQLQPEKMIDPVTGQPIVVAPQHGIPNPPPQPELVN